MIILGILLPLSIIATTAKLYYDAKTTEEKNNNLIAGHDLCAPWAVSDTGVYGRNEDG